MSILFRQRAAALEARGIDQQVYAHTPGVHWAGGTRGIQSALRLTPIYSAVTLIADALITMPLHAYRETGGNSRTKVVQQPKLVADPSPFVDPLSWRGQYVASMLLRGNAFGYNLDIVEGRPQQMVWLNPDLVTMDETRDRPVYLYSGKELQAGRITHVRGATMPGAKLALSPISLFRTQIQAGLGADEFSAAWFENGGAPAAMLRNTAKSLSAEQASTAKERFKATVAAGDVMVVGADWDYTQLTVGAADAKFVETAKLTANHIASIYHVPPDEIGGETGGSLTYSTLELNDLKFVRRGAMPWTVRLEQAINGHLPPGEYVKFNLDAYVRADLMTRMQAHRIGLQIGLETQDEGRALEDRPPLTDEQVAFWADNYRRMPQTDSTTGGEQ